MAIIGGGGMQYTRSVTSSPAHPTLLYRDLDIQGIRRSINFGETRNNWHTPDMIGLTGGVHGNAIACDYQDGYRVLAAQAVGSRGTLQPNMLNYNGLYLSEDGGDHWSMIQVVDIVGTSNASPNRHSHQTFAYTPGGTPSTRTWYFAVSNSSKSPAFQLWRSTNGGQSWTLLWQLTTMSSTNFNGAVYAAACTADGKLYLGTAGGLWMASNPTAFANFSRVTSVPNDDVRCVRTFEDANDVWITVENNGVYKGTGTSFSKWTNYPRPSPYFLDVCRNDRNRVLVLDPNAAYDVTHNGGTSWTQTTMVQRPGFGDDFPTSVRQDNMMIRWHETNPNIVWLSGAQMSMQSTDGGLTAVPDADYDSLIDAYCVDFHPTDPDKIVVACQDVKGLWTQNGFDWAVRGKLTNNVYNFRGYPKKHEGILQHPGLFGCAAGYFGSYGSTAQSPTWHLTNDPAIPDRYTFFDNSTPDIANYARSAHHTSNPLIGYMGRRKITFKDTVTYPSVSASTVDADQPWLSIVDNLTLLPYLFIGMVTESPNVIYMKQAYGTIARSSNQGASIDATIASGGTNWHAIDDYSPSICVPHNDTTTIYLLGRFRIKKVTGIGGTQSQQDFLDIRDYQGPTKGPNAPSWTPDWIGEYSVNSMSIDPFDENHAIVSFCNVGGINLLETFNLTSATPTWSTVGVDENGHGVIPKIWLDGEFNPHTGDYWCWGFHGFHLIRRLAAHDSIPGIPASHFDRQRARLIGLGG